jgi:hypothetical protein
MKLQINLFIIVVLFISHLVFSQTQKQVTIKGKQTSISNSFFDNLEDAISHYVYGNGFTQPMKFDKSVQNFTITFTTDWMKMDAIQRSYDAWKHPTGEEGELLLDERKASVELYFNGTGTGLTMDIFLEIGEEDNKKMSKIASAEVPKKGSFTISDEIINLMQSGGMSGNPWKGHPTIKYNYSGEVQTDAKMQKDPSGVIFRQDESAVTLAQGVEGMDVLDEFYGKIAEGEFDIGGSDQGSLLSSIGYLLSEGMPVYITEKKYYQIKTGETFKALNAFSSETEVFSVEVTDIEAPSALKSLGKSLSDESAKAPEKKKPEGCDCSCEKYKELMALSKKKKKDIDPSKMQQIDMSCIQKCAMEWAKCQKQ